MGFLRFLFLALAVPSLASLGGGRDLRGRGDASTNSYRAAASAEAANYATISVTGTGTAPSTPDTATINLGVSIVKETAQEALAENTAAVEDIVTALADFGIGEADLQTRYFSVSTEYDYSGPERAVLGYRVNNNIVVTVNNLDNVGAVVDAAIQNGANEVNGINFSNSNVEEAYEIARKAAVADAYARAVLYALEAGVTLGEVMTVREPGAAVFNPGYGYSDAASSAVPIYQGDQEITASIHIVYAIDMTDDAEAENAS